MEFYIMSSFSNLFSHASRASKEVFERKLQHFGLHVGQQFLLELLWNEPKGLTVKEIATRLHVEVPSITRTVKRMAKQGFVEKHLHPTDSRQVIIKLTEKGWELQHIIPQVIIECEEQILSNVSDVERALLMRILTQVIQNGK